jgi:hypothetical protein
MNNPFPAETPDPNIDNPVIPPSDPQPVPEQDPPGVLCLSRTLRGAIRHPGKSRLRQCHR